MALEKTSDMLDKSNYDIVTSFMHYVETNWIECLILAGVFSFIFIFFWWWSLRNKHQKLELRRQIIEKAELLAYAIERERKALEKVTATDQGKKKLLGRINHEIRTPMSGIMGMVSLLAETPLNAEQKEFNQTIKTCGESLLTVINDILLGDVLAHAKLECTAAELEQKDFDLRNSIEEVFDVFASQAANKDIELVYQIDHKIPALVIGDDSRLRQILMNLIENSIKFTSKGEIFLRIGIKGETADKLDLNFYIKDSGIGISENDLKFITHSISHTGAQRNGAGLYLCNRLVSVMGGAMTIYSQPDEGTTVRFNVHVTKGTHALRSHPESISIKGKKILVVEDNPTLRNVLIEEMMYWKLVPIVADSGAQALEILEEKTGIDLVLVEMQMPEMNGMALSKIIRARYSNLPVILLSTMNDEDSRHHPEAISSLVSKPLRHSVLNQHIFSALIRKNESLPVERLAPALMDFSVKHPLRILVAEDNPVNLKLAEKMLGKLGYRPDKVKNGKEVLEQVSKVNYDLIFMDVQMPEMDGLEATRMIRLCLASQPVIIAMTANTMQGDREECIKAGMEDYISKPVDIKELVIKIEKWAVQSVAAST